jgi:hypothetical protein
MTICAVFKVYHPLASVMWAPKNNPVLAIPRIFNFLSLWIYVFSVVLSSLVHVVYIAADQADYHSNAGIVVAYAAIYLACLLIMRPLCN